MTAATAEQLLDSYLPHFCADCGTELPQPGLPCGGCGAVPPVTRQEAEQRLAQPGAVAMLEAVRLRGEARQKQDHVSALLAQADMVEHVDRLEQARDEAAARIPDARAEVTRLGRDLRKARAREDEAAQRVADARANFTAAANAEEAARRTHADAAARTGALVTMNAAGSVLQGDQGALAGATTVRQQAEDALALSRTRLAGLEAALTDAQHAVDNPGQPPRSAITLTLDLARVAMSGDLTERDQAIVRSLGEALARYSGAAEDIAARAVELDKKEWNERSRNQALFLHPLGSGDYGTVANLATGGVPRP